MLLSFQRRIFVLVKSFAALSLVLIVAGCGIRHEPAAHKRSPWVQSGSVHEGYPLPPAMYDGIFGLNLTQESYSAHPTFYNADGDFIRGPIGVAVSLNGVPLADTIRSGWDYRVHPLHYPQPVTWSVRGNGYFPTFSHTVPSEQPILLTSPPCIDSIKIDHPLEITYSAPDADSITVHLACWGTGIYRRDTTRIETRAGVGGYYRTANTGRYSIPAFSMPSYFKSFKPTELWVQLFWQRGDTAHVEGKIFGFVNYVSTMGTYGIKH